MHFTFFFLRSELDDDGGGGGGDMERVKVGGVSLWSRGGAGEAQVITLTGFIQQCFPVSACISISISISIIIV